MKAVIHIGPLKTGTTTIQNFCAHNRDTLRKQGIFYPVSCSGPMRRHFDLFIAVIHSDVWKTGLVHSAVRKLESYALFGKTEFTEEDQEKLWRKFWHTIESNCSQEDIVLFSNENFSRFTEEEVEKCKKLMDPLFDDVSIVFYLRRQPEWLISRYYTMVNVDSMSLNFSDYLNQPELYSLLPYHKLVERWSIFGKDNLKIHIFDKSEFYNNDLLSDFAHTVGFDMAGLERVNDANISMDSASVEFQRLCNKYISPFLDSDGGEVRNPDSDQIRCCIDRIAEINSKPYHLTRSEAQHILDMCREGNDWIAREYLGREKLFNEDVSMYPEEVASPHGLTLERSAEMTVALWKERCEVIRRLERERNRISACVAI